MTIVRRLARPMLAASFVQEGLDAVLHPGQRAERARPLVKAVAGPLGLPEDPDLLIRANGAVIGFGRPCSPSVACPGSPASRWRRPWPPACTCT